jgi:3D (Asp-Asp-Asp) domain-containing protein
MDEDPFADLPNVNQGGGERGVATAMPSATPVTQYSIPRRVLGGRQGDELYDPGTARGVGSLENELTPGVVAVNPSVYPIGTIFRDGDTNEVFLAGDKHGNENPNVVDIYTTPSQYQGVSGTRNIVPIGQIPSSKIPKTAKGVSDLLSNYGKVPQGEGAYTSLGSKESDDPFADLPLSLIHI